MIVWSGALCLLGWILNLAYVSRLEESIHRDARNDAILSARLFTNQSDTIIQSIESRFAVLKHEIVDQHVSLHEAVEQGIISMEHLVLLTFVDAQGRTIDTNSGQDLRATDLSDREHVAVQLSGKVQGLFVGKPVIGRISNKWSIQVTSAVRDHSGKLVGVLVASLDPFYFSKFWSEAYLRSDSFVEMFGADGTLRTSSRDLTRQLSDSVPDMALAKAAAAEEEGSVTTDRKGESYVSYFRRSKYYGTISVVRVSSALLQEKVTAVRIRYLAGGGLITLLFLLVSGWLLSSLRREARTRQRAELAETRLSAAISSMPVGFAIFDSGGELVTENPSFRATYAGGGRSAASRFTDLMRQQHGQGTSPLPNPVELQPNPGSWVRLYEVPTSDGGRICFSVPISDLKRRERDLLASQYMLEANQAQLTSLMQEAQAADRMKTRFLAMMSHELRTPLTAVIGFSELLRDAPLSEEAQFFAQQVDECARSLLAIIDDVFDITKLGAQSTKLNGSLVDLPRMLGSLTDVARLLVRSDSIAVSLDMAPNVPATIFSDELKIRQCLLNFITNAARHTISGRIDILAGCRNGCVEISVRDTGSGIPDAILPRLFLSFDHVATKRDLTVPGLGIGLSICKRLADILGATLHASSQLGVGSTLTISIPMSDMPSTKPGPALQGVPDRAARSSQRILVADDAPSTRMLLVAMLKKLGHEIVAVEDGVRALDEIRENRYDVVALDVQMPHMNGIECAQEIRMLPKSLQPRLLIALTAQTFEEDRKRAAEAGFDCFLAKPFTAQDLTDALAGKLASITPELARV